MGVDDLFSPSEVISRYDMLRVTLVFTFVMFLVATQDIAVDGWALTLLKTENRG